MSRREQWTKNYGAMNGQSTKILYFLVVGTPPNPCTINNSDIYAPQLAIMAEKAVTNKKKLIRKLKSKYRLVLMNDSTFEERFSAFLSPLNVIAGVSAIFFLNTTIVVLILSFSPLREYIPGYSDTETRLRAMRAAVVVDSLGQAQEAQQLYLDNIQRVLRGDVFPDSTTLDGQSNPIVYNELDFSISREDSLLRTEIESRDQYSLNPGTSSSTEFLGLPGVLFFPPVRGQVTSNFDSSIDHFGIDVAAKEGEAIKAVYDGVVVFSSFTSDGGNVIQIQHSGNLISIYKHNSVLLKKVGSRVRAGESIAIIGNSGEFTSGPHLHFELWYNGAPLDPSDFIAFSS